MVSVRKASMITISTQAVQFIMSLLIMILLARILGPKDRGAYAILTLIPFIVLRASSLGLEVANTYFTANKQFELKDIAANSLVMALGASILMILTCIALSFTNFFQDYLKHVNVDIYYFKLIMIAIPLTLLFNFFINILLGKSDFIKYNLSLMSQGIVQLILLVVLILGVSHSLSAAIYSYLLAITAAAFISMLLIYGDTKFKFSLNINLLKKSISFGSRAYMGNLAQYVNYRMDMILASTFLTTTAVGYYAIAVGIAERLWMIPGALGIVLFPKISNSCNDESSTKTTSKVTRNSIAIIILLAILLALSSNLLIAILFGKRFLPAIQPFLILLPGVVLLSISKVLAGDLSGRGRPEFGALSSFAGLVINIPLCFFLIPKWGINGAAFASSISYSISTIIAIIAFNRLTKTPVAEFLLLSSDDFKIYLDIIKAFKGRLSAIILQTRAKIKLTK